MAKKDNEGKPLPPKKPLSAFFLYRAEVYNDVKAKNPDAKITDLTKIISEMWGKVDQSTRSRLEEQYQNNKVIATKEKQEYEEKYGKIERKKKKIKKEPKKGK